ncbi:retrovirus-related pol polyprotein from transposon TNT 1-94 [Tanacetum coccineum]
MAVINDLPQLVNKKGGSYAAIAPKLEPGKFNNKKTTEGEAKSESQWTPYERRVVVQDQRLKSIIMSCLPDDIMEYVISYVSAKETWTDLVHSFEGPLDTKENRIMDLKLEYQTFRAKSTESLSRTYTRYKTLLNELANDGVNLSKHEINVGFVNSLPEKWLTFSQGLRNANHTQILDIADIYGRFVYEDNLIQRRYSDTKNALITTPSSTLISTAFFSNNDEEEVSDEAKVTQVKVLMALANDELTIGKNHARNGEWVDITVRKVNTLLSMDEDADWQTYLNEQIPHQKKKVLGGELFTESSSKMNDNENLFVLASIGYDQVMVLITKDWVKRLNPNSKLLNFNTGRILVPQSQAVNESLESTKILNTHESSKDSKAESLTPLPPLKNLQGASPSSKVMPLTFQPHSPKERPVLGIMKHTKPKTQDSSNKSVSGTVTVNETKQITPSVPTEIRGGVLVESSQSNESAIGVKCNTRGSTVHSTTDSNKFDHFKRETPQGAHLVHGQWMLKEYDWCQELSAQICRATSISQLYDAKYIVQFDDKQGTIFNANKDIVMIAPRRNDVYVLDMSSLTPNRACFFAKASESVNWLWHKRLSHLNFKNINKLAKQNRVLGLSSLVYSKDKPCIACEKGNHHGASFKTKQNFSIMKSLHLLHMDFFGPVSPVPINHEKYTLVIVDEYSRMVENQNDVKVRQIRTDNRTEFRNHELESFCDEKGICQNFSSPYTPEQNGVAERKNRTLIKAARTMLNGLVLSKHLCRIQDLDSTRVI